MSAPRETMASHRHKGIDLLGYWGIVFGRKIFVVSCTCFISVYSSMGVSDLFLRNIETNEHKGHLDGRA